MTMDPMPLQDLSMPPRQPEADTISALRAEVATVLAREAEAYRRHDAKLEAAEARAERAEAERDALRAEVERLTNAQRMTLDARLEMLLAENSSLRKQVQNMLDHFTAQKARAERAEAELAAARAARTVKVKPLDWVKHSSKDIWRAITGLGVYKVFAVTFPSWDFDSWSDGKDKISQSAQSIEAAKAAAQADYEARILAALDMGDTE